MQLEILTTSKDGLTGRISLTCRVIDGSSVGATEKFGISAEQISSVYGGSVENWVAEAIAPSMKQRHIARTAVHTNLSLLRGKKLDI